jgi:hypothetical protein
MKRKIVLHLTVDALENWRSAARFEFYRRLELMAELSGVELLAVRAKKTKGTASPEMEDGNLHIVHGGSINGLGCLNASMAYLPGFWHVNPVGTLADSPASLDVFNPDEVKRRSADVFYEKLQQKFVLARNSRYRQKKSKTELPQNSVAVVLQGRHPYANRQNHMTMEDMIYEVLTATESEVVVVKPHPLETEFGLQAVKKFGTYQSRLVVTDANIHDLLSAARVVVSVNSSVTFEGFMHSKPSLLFGRCDFPSLVNTVRAQGEFASAYEDSLRVCWDYPKMLYWYFKKHTVAVRSRKMKSYLSKQINAAGLKPEEFGMPACPETPQQTVPYEGENDAPSDPVHNVGQS